MANDLVQKYESLKSKYEEKKNEKTVLETKLSSKEEELNSLLKELKEYKLNSIEEAEQYLTKLKAKINSVLDDMEDNLNATE